MNCSWWSVEEEFFSLATGKKFFCSLVVGQWVLMYLLLDGSRQQHFFFFFFHLIIINLKHRGVPVN